MMKHTQSGDLARDQFLAVCQELMECAFRAFCPPPHSFVLVASAPACLTFGTPLYGTHRETMKGMGFRFVTITVLSPLMAMSARKGLDRTLCRLVPWIGKVLGYIPDSLFVPFAASLMSAFTPVLLDMARPAKARGSLLRFRVDDRPLRPSCTNSTLCRHAKSSGCLLLCIVVSPLLS